MTQRKCQQCCNWNLHIIRAGPCCTTPHRQVTAQVRSFNNWWQRVTHGKKGQLRLWGILSLLGPLDSNGSSWLQPSSRIYWQTTKMRSHFKLHRGGSVMEEPAIHNPCLALLVLSVMRDHQASLLCRINVNKLSLKSHHHQINGLTYIINFTQMPRTTIWCPSPVPAIEKMVTMKQTTLTIFHR